MPSLSKGKKEKAKKKRQTRKGKQEKAREKARERENIEQDKARWERGGSM